MDQEEKNLRLSMFNTAMGQMQRLNELFDACTNARFRLNKHGINVWYVSLTSINLEIDSKLSDEHRKKIKQELHEGNVIVQKFLSNTAWFQARGVPSIIVSKLEHIELLLRRFADQAGLLNPNKLSVMDTLFKEDKD